MQIIYLDRKRGSMKGEGARGTTSKWMPHYSKPSFPIIFSESSGGSNDGADTKVNGTRGD